MNEIHVGYLCWILWLGGKEEITSCWEIIKAFLKAHKSFFITKARQGEFLSWHNWQTFPTPTYLLNLTLFFHQMQIKHMRAHVSSFQTGCSFVKETKIHSHVKWKIIYGNNGWKFISIFPKKGNFIEGKMRTNENRSHDSSLENLLVTLMMMMRFCFTFLRWKVVISNNFVLKQSDISFKIHLLCSIILK